jgi:hypothetical protein
VIKFILKNYTKTYENIFINNFRVKSQFNEFFLNDSELNSVHNLKSGSVYSIGNSLHTFINNSNKVRVNLVFEVNP